MAGLEALPTDLPAPADDGGCAHLPGLALPKLPLASTQGSTVDLSAPFPGRTVVYAYPMTGRPDIPLPDGWDAIPGARGCTPQSCSFRDHKAELDAVGARVFGLSTQSTAYQREAAERLHLSFALLSDENLALTGALGLPTFRVDDAHLLKRATIIIDEAVITHVLYPVFPPDRSAADTLAWLRANPA
ncbi:MAG: peroxiredoxin [Pseudomonadota bacterium]